MARTVTLAQLITDVREQADVVGATVRHTDARITRLINQAIQRFRRRVTLEGESHYRVSATGTLTTGATSPYQFSVLDLTSVSPAIVRIIDVDVVLSDQDTKRLRHVPFDRRNDYGRTVSEPDAWFNLRTAEVAILPAPDSPYTYIVWYIPTVDDLAQPTDTFDGVQGWEDYIVWEVVLRVIVKDQYPQAYAMAASFRSEIWDDIMRAARRVTSQGGAHVARDTMAESLYGGGGGFRRLPPP